MILIVRLFLVTIFLALCVRAGWWWLPSARTYEVQASGSVTCNGDPMPFVKVILMDGRRFSNTKMDQTTADANGAFQVWGSRASGKPRPLIRVCYSYSGIYGKLKVVDFSRTLRCGRTNKRSYKSNINFGTMNFVSISCNAYVQFYKALKYYNEDAGSTLPYSTLYVEANTFLYGGTPYATTNTVQIPSNYPVTYNTAQHEFAHTIRHSLDGNFWHFLIDATK